MDSGGLRYHKMTTEFVVAHAFERRDLQSEKLKGVAGLLARLRIMGIYYACIAVIMGFGLSPKIYEILHFCKFAIAITFFLLCAYIIILYLY
jgi:hypothetical protein